MSDTPLLYSFQEASKTLLKTLSSRRMQEVLEKRFGLRGGGKKTLETVGKDYKITRERVRQIEAEALRHVRRAAASGMFDPLIQTVSARIAEYGHVLSERDFLTLFGDSDAHPHILFFLTISGAFHMLPETGNFYRRWTIDRERADAAERIMTAVANEFKETRACAPKEKLDEIIAQKSKEIFGESIKEQARTAYCALSKQIRKNPYGDYGLAEWPMISPSGMRDKAYAALVKAKQPLHFLDVAQEITRANWSKRKANPQTVHNELIKDSRFVLVGRGLYALKEWGYAPGPVRDVVCAVLAESKRAMTRDEIIQAVLKKRFVKEPTILLNLQNRGLFRRTDDGKYMLV